MDTFQARYIYDGGLACIKYLENNVFSINTANVFAYKHCKRSVEMSNSLYNELLMKSIWRMNAYSVV